MSTNIRISTLDHPSPDLVGNKFRQLAEISSLCDVPQAVCINNSVFQESLDPDAQTEIGRILTMLHSNGGYQLNKHQQQIMHQLAALEVPAEAKQEVIAAAEALSNGWKSPVIVRSSSCFEDGDDASGAGIYESVPNLQTADQLIEAVLYCWKASFSLGALAHRLRIGEFALGPLPGLIIQRYVKADWSGVCFSVDPLTGANRIFIEYTKDSSDGVEAGTGEVGSFAAIASAPGSYLFSRHELPKDIAQELAETSQQLITKYDRPMEYEWAVEQGKLLILQARPITTTGQRSHQDDKQQAAVFDLYQDSAKIDQLDIGEIAPIYRHSITKRKSIRMFAHERGVAINGAAVTLLSTSRTIDDLADQPALSRLRTPVFTIDLGPHLRSFYAERAKLNEVIRALLGDANSLTPMIIREFASGQFSAVSMVQGDGVMIEVCRGSLIGINRGFVETASYMVSNDGRKVTKVAGSLDAAKYYGFDVVTKSFAFLDVPAADAHEIEHTALVAIAKFTNEVADKFDDNILEWTVIDGQPVYIDNTPNTTTSSLISEVGEAMFISPGQLKGRVLVIDDLQKLEYISSGPTLNVNGHLPTLEANKEIQELKDRASRQPDLVIVSKFPYTALSVLIGQVAGFIFESGPVLCHLAIIARENQTPVAIVQDALQRYHDGEEVEL